MTGSEQLVRATRRAPYLLYPLGPAVFLGPMTKAEDLPPSLGTIPGRSTSGGEMAPGALCLAGRPSTAGNGERRP